MLLLLAGVQRALPLPAMPFGFMGGGIDACVGDVEQGQGLDVLTVLEMAPRMIAWPRSHLLCDAASGLPQQKARSGARSPRAPAEMSRLVGQPLWDEDLDLELEREFEDDLNDRAAVAEYHASLREQEQTVAAPRLVGRLPSRGRKNSRKQPTVDLTHALFAAVQQDCSVSRVTEDTALAVAEDEEAGMREAVRRVIEHLVERVEHVAVMAERQHAVDDVLERRPMCVTRLLCFVIDIT